MIPDSAQWIPVVRNGFGGPRVLVVGDVMLDKYVCGEVERISPEAPVPVLRTARNSQQPGGAANVAMNLAGLGARVSLMGFAGGDHEQRDLEALLRAAGVEPQLVARPGVPTTTKLRVLAGRQQLLRLDNDPQPTDCNAASDILLRQALEELPRSAVLVLSDYAKGALHERACRALIGEARRLQIPVVVDPKGNDFNRYRGATTICPNAKELALVTGESAGELRWLLAAGQKLVAALDLQHMLVTLGEKGIAILRQDSCLQVAATAREVFDVSGAGDTVVALVAAAMAARLPVEISVRLANVAAGIVIGKIGTVPIQRDELLGAISTRTDDEPGEKLMPRDVLRVCVMRWRSRGYRIVFTNGCFDLLHVGHVSLLEQAKAMGDRLIVAVNSDSSVRKLKGRQRPLVPEQDRARILAAMSVVDAVVVFDEPTPLQLIAELRPDVLVKGGDYREDDVVGAVEVRGWGGRLALVPLVAGCSTTRILERSAESAALGAQA